MHVLRSSPALHTMALDLKHLKHLRRHFYQVIFERRVRSRHFYPSLLPIPPNDPVHEGFKNLWKYEYNIARNVNIVFYIYDPINGTTGCRLNTFNDLQDYIVTEPDPFLEIKTENTAPSASESNQ